jgi:glycosyltransferase involved in cell wall biosynthesis
MDSSVSTLPPPVRANSSLGDAPMRARQSATRLRVALLTNEIPPYCVPYYRELAATPEWDFQVFTCVEREADRQWAVAEKLPFATRRCFSLSYMRHLRRAGRQGFDDIRQIHLPIGLLWELMRFKPDVILSGELGARTLIAALYARLFGRRLIVSFEGTPHTESDITRAQRCLRRLVRRAPHAYTVNGTQGRQYLQSLHVPATAIFEVGQSIDTESFAKPTDAHRRKALRNEWGVAGQCFLFCGRLIPLKGLDQLLDGWEVFSRHLGAQATLVLAGDGSEKDRLKERVARANLTNVRFLGNVPREQLADVYQAADVFVLPTLVDCWALVVNEAMASGLPVINSKYAGSTELIVEGETGWVVDPRDQTDVVAKLQAAWDARDRRQAMGSAARKAVAAMSIPAVAERVRQAVDAARTTSRLTRKAWLGGRSS